MYEFVRSIGVSGFIAREAIPLALSLLVAELFFKFHSFTLEAVAFLITWFCISALAVRLVGRRVE